MSPYLSLVIPAYNEAQRLPPTLEKLAEFCATLSFPHEVLVVVERSTDGTLAIANAFAAQQAHFRVIDNAVHRGKGFAVRSGMRRARGAHVFYMDADLSVPLQEVHGFLAHFEAHPEIDVLVGNRQHARSRITQRQTRLREHMGKVFNRVLQTLALHPLRDTQCGFKAFRGRVARTIFSVQQLDGFAFDVEVLLLAERLGCKVADLPVEWINSPESKVHIVRDSLAMLWDMVRVRRLIEQQLSDPAPAGNVVAARKTGC